MKIGFVGLGKLGLPVALAIASKGHEVLAFDVNPAARRNLERRRLPYPERRGHELFARVRIRVTSLKDLVNTAEILFVAVQTPHESRLDGASRLPPYRCDFDYSYLVSAVADVASAARGRDESLTLAVMSTVLPTTIDRRIRPLLPPEVTVVYNPSFTAMGTTIPDFLNPEFVLLGLDEPDCAATAALERFYATLHGRPVFKTDVRTAELIKVAYNTFIGQKIVFANTMMELCHKLGADVDALTDALGLAQDRIISTRYLRGGMGDGGPCHPRDNIALSWLSREVGLSHDLFSDVMEAREHQIEWLADLLEERAAELPIVILGKAFKADTPLAVGSPAQLLAAVLRERGVQFAHYDGRVDRIQNRLEDETASLFFIATCHTEYARARFPPGSVVLDPWGYIPDRDGVTVVRIGRR